LVALLAFHLLVPAAPWYRIVGTSLGVAVLIAALASVAGRRSFFWVGLALMAPSLASLWGWGGLGALRMGGSAFHAPFFLFATWVVSAEVLRAERVTEDTLVGTICSYLFLCLAFAALYEAVELTVPGSFAALEAAGEGRLFGSLSYFSLVTLTTLGYGDITPLTTASQSLVILESVIGILFPAIVVARIVAVYTAGGARPFTRPEVDPSGEAQRVGALTVLIVAAILALPWLEQSPWARLLVNAAIILLLLGGLFAVMGERKWISSGPLLAGLAIGGRLWTAFAGTSPVTTAGLAFEVAFVGLVSVRIGLWAFRQQRVTAGVLFSAPCLFLLAGVGFASAFELAERIAPGAVALSVEPTPFQMLYFSFMTLTTTGFGDLTPQIPMARALAAAESVIGIFFPAIVLARLVALYDVAE
jgi:voltage-gated potassium channel Kch